MGLGLYKYEITRSIDNPSNLSRELLSLTVNKTRDWRSALLKHRYGNPDNPFGHKNITGCTQTTKTKTHRKHTGAIQVLSKTNRRREKERKDSE